MFKVIAFALAIFATAVSAQVTSSSSSAVSVNGTGSANSMSSSSVRNMGMPQVSAVTSITGSGQAFGSAYGANQFGSASALSVKPTNSFSNATAPLTVQSFKK